LTPALALRYICPHAAESGFGFLTRRHGVGRPRARRVCRRRRSPFGPWSPSVRLLDADLAVTISARFGLWDGAFGPAGELLNEEDERRNSSAPTAGAHDRRSGTHAPQEPGGSRPDWRNAQRRPRPHDAPARAKLSSSRRGSAAGSSARPRSCSSSTTASRGSAVSRPTTKQQPTTSGLPGVGGLRRPAEDGHRLRVAGMKGSSRSRSRRARARRRVAGLRAARLGRLAEAQIQASSPADCAANAEARAVVSWFFDYDLPFIRLVYERTGLAVTTAVDSGTLEEDVVRRGPPTRSVLVRAEGADPARIGPREALTLAMATPEPRPGRPAGALGDTIRLFYGGRPPRRGRRGDRGDHVSRCRVSGRPAPRRLVRGRAARRARSSGRLLGGARDRPLAHRSRGGEGHCGRRPSRRAPVPRSPEPHESETTCRSARICISGAALGRLRARGAAASPWRGNRTTKSATSSRRATSAELGHAT